MGMKGKPAGSGFHSHHLPREAFTDEEQVETVSPQGHVTWEPGPAGGPESLFVRERLAILSFRFTSESQVLVKSAVSGLPW